MPVLSPSTFILSQDLVNKLIRALAQKILPPARLLAYRISRAT